MSRITSFLTNLPNPRKTKNATRNTLTALFLLFAITVSGQSEVNEGVIRYLATQNWTKMMTAVDYISKQQRERDAYMWGNRSEWKSYRTLYFSPTQTLYMDSEERAEPDDDGYSWKKDDYFIQRNYATNTYADVMEVLGKTYVVEDSIRAPVWKIHNDLKEVAGHLCMKAMWYDSLKAQKVVAWFAMDMPLSAGPERFSGLPGLILEIDINDGALNVTADRIEAKKLSTEFTLPKKIKGKKIKEADYTAILRKHFEEKRKAEQPPFWGIRY